VRRYRTSDGCRCTRTSLGALLPLDGGDRSNGANPGRRKRAAGTRRCVLRGRRVLRGNLCTRDARPHPEERACRRSTGDWTARARVSKDEEEPPSAPSCFETYRSAARLGKELRSRGAATLLSMRTGRDQPAAVRNPRHCFRIVIYNDFCNWRVSTSPRRQNRLGRSRRRCARAPQRPSRIHTAATLPRSSKSPIKPAKTGSTPIPRTTLASRVRSPNQSSP
jgi:hypothetical protein